MNANGGPLGHPDLAAEPASFDAGSSEIVIEPNRGWGTLRLRELWQSRGLLYFFIWRDIKVRYKQTALGAAWAVAQPLLTMVVFSLFFGKLARMPSDGIPYPIFSFAGLVPWTVFGNALGGATSSMVSNSQLLSKVYFPRLVIPIGAVLAFTLDLAISFGVLIGMMAYFHIWLGSGIVWIPAAVVLTFCTALGAGIWLASLNVYFRDIRYIQPFIIQFWMFATPVVYPSSLVKGIWRTIYGLNPMAGAVEAFRWGLLHAGPRPGGMLIVSALTCVMLLITGLIVFRRLEPTFADVV